MSYIFDYLLIALYTFSLLPRNIVFGLAVCWYLFCLAAFTAAFCFSYNGRVLRGARLCRGYIRKHHAVTPPTHKDFVKRCICRFPAQIRRGYRRYMEEGISIYESLPVSVPADMKTVRRLLIPVYDTLMVLVTVLLLVYSGFNSYGFGLTSFMLAGPLTFGLIIRIVLSVLFYGGRVFAESALSRWSMLIEENVMAVRSLKAAGRAVPADKKPEICGSRQDMPELTQRELGEFMRLLKETTEELDNSGGTPEGAPAG